MLCVDNIEGILLVLSCQSKDALRRQYCRDFVGVELSANENSVCIVHVIMREQVS